MEGGDLGFSLTRKRAGAARQMVKMHCISMKLWNLAMVTVFISPPLSSSILSPSENIRRMRI